MLTIILSLFPKSQLHNIMHLRKYCLVGSWEIKKDILLELVFYVFMTTSRLISTLIALHTSLILKIVHLALEKIQCSWLCYWVLGNRAKYLLLALVFHVFNTTSCLVSTSIALHAQLILKKFPFLLEKNMENKYK